jgi:hypothetical protein
VEWIFMRPFFRFVLQESTLSRIGMYPLPVQFLASLDSTSSGIKALARAGRTLGACRAGLLSHFQHRASGRTSQSLPGIGPSLQPSSTLALAGVAVALSRRRPGHREILTAGQREWPGTVTTPEDGHGGTTAQASAPGRLKKM